MLGVILVLRKTVVWVCHKLSADKPLCKFVTATNFLPKAETLIWMIMSNKKKYKSLTFFNAFVFHCSAFMNERR